MRQSLAALIESTAGYTVVVTYGSAEDTIRLLPGREVDVVPLDIHLPGRSGIDCVARLRGLLPGAQFMMLTVEEDPERVFESLKVGATGYLVKHVPSEEILEAITQVHAGGAPMSSHIARLVVTAFRQPVRGAAADPRLSPREQENLQLLGRGLRSKEIAESLGIGTGTVNTHVRHLYEKLHVRSRAEAVARGMTPQS